MFFNLADTINKSYKVTANGEWYCFGAGVTFFVTEWVGPAEGYRTSFVNFWGELVSEY